VLFEEKRCRAPYVEVVGHDWAITAGRTTANSLPRWWQPFRAGADRLQSCPP
jgi:hypothetical protein